MDNGKSFPVAAVKFEAGNTVLGNTPMALYDPSQLGGPIPGAKGGAADGMIGLDVLKGHRAIIDYRSRQIFFRSGSAGGPDVAGLTRIPIREDGRGCLAVGANLRGRPGRFRIDTGASVTVLNEPALLAVGISSSPSKLTAAGFDGRVRPLALAQIDDLKIGGVPIAAQPLAVMDIFGNRPPPKTLRLGFQRVRGIERRDSGGEPLFGLLGSDVLDARHAVIDLDSMTLFLK